MKIFSVSFVIFILCIVITSCNKDKLKSKYLSALQHKWTVKSTTKRFSVIGSYQGPWNTTQLPPNTYREFTTDGNYYLTSPGFTYTTPYKIMSDSVILYLHPAAAGSPYADPDTSFIRQINESLFINYSRKFYGSAVYMTLDEYIDSLIR